MEILPAVPDELFSDTFSSAALGLEEEGSDAADIKAAALDLVLEDIITNVIFGFSLEIHRMCKKGVLFIEDTDTESIQQFKIVDTPGFDIFGQELKKKSLECVCPNCERLMAASRFAPHLEKCMGMGRCSSRVASRRIANNISKQEGSDNDSLGGDNDIDNDWSTGKRSKKVKKEKYSSSLKGRGRPANKMRTEAAGELDVSTLLAMDVEQRKSVLMNICGALSEPNSKKICTRPAKCTLHSDEVRQLSRHNFLVDNGSQRVLTPTAGCHPLPPDDEVDIDIDTFDDLDSQILRDALWEKDRTPTASPADSTSTVNSNSSKKRGRKKKSKRNDK